MSGVPSLVVPKISSEGAPEEEPVSIPGDDDDRVKSFDPAFV